MISEVHVEFICRDGIWTSLRTWAAQNPQARLMLLIDSCPHCEHRLFPCDVKSRYWKLSHANPIGLHTHLFYPRHWWVDNLTYDQQYTMLRNGVSFLEELNIKTTHFVPGNWRFNRDSVEACYELGLLDFHWHEHEDNKETVEWAKKIYKDMTFISAKGCYTHDWTIHHKNKVLVRV